MPPIAGAHDKPFSFAKGRNKCWREGCECTDEQQLRAGDGQLRPARELYFEFLDLTVRGEGGEAVLPWPAAVALPLLSLAEAHQAPTLRLFAMHAVVRNWAAVGASDDFRALPPPLRKEAEWYARSLLL